MNKIINNFWAIFRRFILTVSLFTIPFLGLAQEMFEKDLVKVKGGCFQMGDQFGDGVDLEKPVHKVCLADFYISKYETTQQQWQSIMGSIPSKTQGNPRYPVDVVSWWDVERFIEKLNDKSKHNYRLPTEAEWEYACRGGGAKVKFGTRDGKLSKDLAVYDQDEKKGGNMMPVGSFPPNSLGIYDMSGNVSEWVMDWYERDYYEKSPVNNPIVLKTRLETLKVRRGGHW